MIFEPVDLGIDIESLRQHLQEVVFPLEPVMVGRHFGGWSVLSSTGDYRDGWGQGFRCYKVVDGKTVIDYDAVQRLNLPHPNSYVKPTQICTGYMSELIRKLVALGLTPRRARVTLLKAGPGSSCSWHRDGPDEAYAVRLHVPIITNEGCFFRTENEQEHAAADGRAYFVRVNRMHQVVNGGPTDRLHLIMETTDTRGISCYHRFPQ